MSDKVVPMPFNYNKQYCDEHFWTGFCCCCHPLSSTPSSPFSIWISLLGKFNLVASLSEEAIPNAPSPISENEQRLRVPDSSSAHSLPQPWHAQPSRHLLPGLQILTKWGTDKGNVGGQDHSHGHAGECPGYSCGVTLVHLAPSYSSFQAWFSSLLWIWCAPKILPIYPLFD